MLLTESYNRLRQIAMMDSYRNLILLPIKSILSLLTLVFLAIVIHEGAHFITALILAVPNTHFTWFDPNYFAPLLYSVSTEHATEVTIVSYVGGLLTGLLLLIVLVVKRTWFVYSLYRWLIGLYIAALGFYQIALGIYEGAFHEQYISNATDIFSSLHLICYSSAFLGMTLYWIFISRLKGLETNESS